MKKKKKVPGKEASEEEEKGAAPGGKEAASAAADDEGKKSTLAKPVTIVKEATPEPQGRKNSLEPPAPGSRRGSASSLFTPPPGSRRGSITLIADEVRYVVKFSIFILLYLTNKLELIPVRMHIKSTQFNIVSHIFNISIRFLN